MHPDKLPATFVTHAADVLAHTDRGLSGSQIVKITAAHAIDRDVGLPEPTFLF
jgi:hypothetical protein